MADGAEGRQCLQVIEVPSPMRRVTAVMDLKIVVSVACATAMIVTGKRCLAQHQPSGAFEIRFISDMAHDLIALSHRSIAEAGWCVRARTAAFGRFFYAAQTSWLAPPLRSEAHAAPLGAEICEEITPTPTDL